MRAEAVYTEPMLVEARSLIHTAAYELPMVSEAAVGYQDRVHGVTDLLFIRTICSIPLSP